MQEYRIRYRDPNGRDLVSMPKPTVAKAIQHARVLELHHGTILAVIGPKGEVSWDELVDLAEGQER
jgi:hypothetical protein